MRRIIILILLSLLFLASCSETSTPSETNEVNLLETAQNKIDSLLYSIWDFGDANSIAVHSSDFNEQTIRTVLNNTLDRYSEIYEMAYVDSLGILKYIEPEEYRAAEGTDISTQEHVIRLFNTKKRVLSNIFQLVEGYHAIVMETPIMMKDRCLGSISPIFKPHYLIGNLTKNIESSGIVDDFLVIDTNGLIIFDTDSSQIGRNTFTDPLYKDFTDVHRAAQEIIAGNSGKTEYSFLNKDKNTVVKKDVWWRTSDYYGTKWKFCIIKERI
ncbi:hypothetical protein MASR1M45_07410 [Candidatus Kapaibacterium sp.]